MAYVNYFDYCISDNMISSKDLLAGYEFSEKESNDFIRKTGLKDISVLELSDEKVLYRKLLTKFFEQTHTRCEDISHIIYVNMMGFSNGVCLPYILQKEFHMDNATVVLLQEKCGATLQGIEFAQGLIEVNEQSNILIMSTVISEGSRYIDTTILGDGISIMHLSNSQNYKYKVIDVKSFTDGTYSYKLSRGEKFKLNVYNVIMKGCYTIKELLHSHNLTFENIERIVPLNISNASFELYSSILEIDMDMFYLKNISNGGHLGDVDTIRNLTDITDECEFEKGDKLVVYSLGYKSYDITYYAMLIEV